MRRPAIQVDLGSDIFYNQMHLGLWFFVWNMIACERLDGFGSGLNGRNRLWDVIDVCVFPSMMSMTLVLSKTNVVTSKSTNPADPSGARFESWVNTTAITSEFRLRSAVIRELTPSYPESYHRLLKPCSH